MSNCIIREIKQAEIFLLNDFLYEAIFMRDENNPFPRDIIKQPELNIFIENYGESTDDSCLVAEVDGKVAGAVWARILCGDIKGFGNVDEHTPELAISLYKQYRNKGIGTRLIEKMLVLLKNKNFSQVSLAVQKDNFAVKMYEKTGFRIIGENEEEYIMLCKIKAS